MSPTGRDCHNLPMPETVANKPRTECLRDLDGFDPIRISPQTSASDLEDYVGEASPGNTGHNSPEQAEPLTEPTQPVFTATIAHENSRDIISTEPGSTEEMAVAPRASKGENGTFQSRRSSMATVSSQGSGYERETHECTEFCIDFLRCFGMFDECCPSSGEGYFTTAAIFCANIFVGMRKC